MAAAPQFEASFEEGLKGMFSGKGKAKDVFGDSDTKAAGDEEAKQETKLSEKKNWVPKPKSFRRDEWPIGRAKWDNLVTEEWAIKIFQEWPRDPNGINMVSRISETSYGKKTPSRLHWGATLNDWFWYRRVPSVENFVSKASSSQLMGWMKANGELFAKEYLEDAETEPDPELIYPYDFRKLVRERDALNEDKRGTPHPAPKLEEDAMETDKPVQADFSESHYVPRFVPFTDHPITLQERLHLRLLPEKLIVHDPYGCLAADEYNYTHPSSEKWEEINDRAYVYKIQHDFNTMKDRMETMKDFDDMVGPNIGDFSVSTAHLYISRNSFIGEGNHSWVYDVEWELPRTLLDLPVRGKEIPDSGNDSDNELPSSAADTPGTTDTTFTVRVAAKLSKQHDRHLLAESKNYQRFREHLFQHWTGFNVCYPIHTPVPATAVVPQFYGYYVPDESCSSNGNEYLSPILLLENCGKPIRVSETKLGDREECASLLLRFHIEGWVHNSVAVRNIVQQNGPLHFHPSKRSDEWKSFRLIDFGRSLLELEHRKEEIDKGGAINENRHEEMHNVISELKILHCQ